MFVKCFLLGVCLCMTGCGGPDHMVVADSCSPISTIKSSNDKSLLVIARSGIYGGIFNIENYLDDSMVGVTRWSGYFMTEVSPGQHFVTAKLDNFDSALMNFEPNKIYYLRNNIEASRIVGGIRARLTSIDINKANDLFLDGCKYYVYNNDNIKLDQKEFEIIKRNYYEFNDIRSPFTTTSVLSDEDDSIYKYKIDADEKLTKEKISPDYYSAKYNTVLISGIKFDPEFLNNLEENQKAIISNIMPQLSQSVKNGIVEYLTKRKISKVIQNSSPNESDKVVQLEITIRKVNWGNRAIKAATYAVTQFIGFSTGDARTYISISGKLSDYTTKQEVAVFDEEEAGLEGTSNWMVGPEVVLPYTALQAGVNVGKFFERNSSKVITAASDMTK